MILYTYYTAETALGNGDKRWIKSSLLLKVPLAGREKNCVHWYLEYEANRTKKRKCHWTATFPMWSYSKVLKQSQVVQSQRRGGIPHLLPRFALFTCINSCSLWEQMAICGHRKQELLQPLSQKPVIKHQLFAPYLLPGGETEAKNLQ